ncbi:MULTISPECIES: DUF2637 domain-containing protein [unclassified Micromonospora]|uniref:DUF2637 domain-containing protein n=1 Tax=unclassified Micromonospora TaxID=2617518 RepID=UPI0022B72A92|nr:MULTISPECIES: DUF2637 domain-containing protein [unclassified Micromonospora]MCZ7421648.1 DUF2637 domain-containing protein [Verrucosispora sp. WMMA2121]WBB93673.1 DUF2637 domain-containing protein [Verrucosispora sp. WMMC514]
MNARRFASLAGTVAVTVIAAVASYDHMRELAERAGQPPLLAALRPLSVDGMILVAMLALGDGRRSRWSAWLAFVLGVAASLAANVIVAEPNATARVVSAWPAVALLLTVEILTRSGTAPPAPVEKFSAALAAPAPALGTPALSTATARPPVTVPPRSRPPAVPPDVRLLPVVARVSTPPATPDTLAAPIRTADRVAALLAAEPNATPAQVAARLGMSERTARRYMPADKMPPRRRQASRVPAMATG